MEPYRFCYTCGHKLHIDKYITSYDGVTGAPNYQYSYRCLNQPFLWSQERHPVTEIESYVFRG